MRFEAISEVADVNFNIILHLVEYITTSLRFLSYSFYVNQRNLNFYLYIKVYIGSKPLNRLSISNV